MGCIKCCTSSPKYLSHIVEYARILSVCSLLFGKKINIDQLQKSKKQNAKKQKAYHCEQAIFCFCFLFFAFCLLLFALWTGLNLTEKSIYFWIYPQLNWQIPESTPNSTYNWMNWAIFVLNWSDLNHICAKLKWTKKYL